MVWNVASAYRPFRLPSHLLPAKLSVFPLERP